MRNLRKGFTLVELLIVISILGALSASMAGSMGNSTAVAKASTIVANIDTCKAAAKMYYSANYNENLATYTAAKFLAPTDDEVTAGAVKYVPNWSSFTTAAKNIVYGIDAKDSGQGADKWAVQVDFSLAPDKDDILTALKKNVGYENIAASTYKFKVTLLTGEVGTFVAQE